MAVVNLRSKKLKYHQLKSVFLKPLMEAAASETALDSREYFAKLSYVPDVDLSWCWSVDDAGLSASWVTLGLSSLGEFSFIVKFKYTYPPKL